MEAWVVVVASGKGRTGWQQHFWGFNSVLWLLYQSKNGADFCSIGAIQVVQF